MTRPPRSLPLALAAVGLASALVVGCQPTPPTDAALPDGVIAERITPVEGDVAGHWVREGFTLMTPSVPLPTLPRERSRIDVYVRLAPGTQIDVEEGPGGPILRWPELAEADRVESLSSPQTGRFAVADVRGGQIVEGDQVFRVYRPERGGFDGVALEGFRWPRSRDDLGEVVRDAFLHRFDDGGAQVAPVEGRALAGRKRTFFLQHRCAQCHTLQKPAVALEGETPVHRASDAAGWYMPQAALASSLPLETYRPAQHAHENPFITLSCPGGATPERHDAESGATSFTCPERAVVTATLDVPAALAAGDEHARAVCASRRFLREHMTEAARGAFADAFAACGL